MKPDFYMNMALSLARRGIGNTGPNPTVGCVIVKDGVIIAEGRTAPNGRPHAETIALKKAGDKAKGASVYVTLEPCSHHGKTPPCAEALIEAKPAEVIIACLDPDSRVNGRGIKMLAEAGIKITLGTGEKEALEINRGFIKRIKHGIPFVTLKVATSLDGKYLKGTGKARMFTSDNAQRYVHLLRSRADVLLTGTGTILADSPKLNVRLPGLEDTSPRIVVLGKRKLPEKYQKLATRSPLLTTLKELAAEGVNYALVEAGPALAASFIKEGLVDELQIIESPEKLGSDGEGYFAPEIKKLLPKNFRKTAEKQLGVDILRVFARIK